MNTNKIFLIFALIFSTFASAQVGIGTQNPQGIFNIDGAKDNAASGAPTTTQQRNDFVVMPSGKVGIGTTAPTANIEVLSNDVSTYVSTASFFAPSNTTSGNNTLLNFGVSPSQGNSAQFRFVYTGSDAVTNRVDLGMNGYVTPFVTYTRVGNVGIGTTSPTQKLDVVGAGLFRNGNDSGQSSKDQILMSYNTTPNFTHSIKTRHSISNSNDNAIDFYTWNQGVDANATIGTKQVMSLLGNGNVGIGTTAPDRILSVVQAGNGTSFISNASTNLMRFESTANSSSIGHYFKAKNAVGTDKEIVMGLNPNSNTNNGVFFIGLGSGSDLIGFDLVNYNSYVSTLSGSKFGIGTKLPTSKLEVSGAATNTVAHNAAAASTIDFALSNLAYTSATANAITLSNIKDGGAYSLIFTSTAVNDTVTFSATGFTFKYMGTGARTSGKAHIYSFIVAGTVVYVSMSTEN